jgi:4-hydroxybenzoate polyprenyltransferase
MIREYLKLARSFNAVLTGVSPVMGAIAMERFDLVTLFLLFCVGFLGHTYGFVLNDIIDYRIDKTSKDISDRPLISGTIPINNAWWFAVGSMFIAFIIAVYLSNANNIYFPLLLLLVSAIFISIYNLISKRFPAMDIFVALGVFFLILFGAGFGLRDGIPISSISDITPLAWIVCILGSIQVLFMQFIAGGMKDIENDYIQGAKTLAIKLGVRVINGKLKMSTAFRFLAYGLQIGDLVIVFLPFMFIWDLENLSFLHYFQWTIIFIIAIMMFILSHRLLSMKYFIRKNARRYIGSHYMVNFAIVPIMLMSLNPWAGLLVFFPGLGFILNNIIIHGTLLQPKTM